MAVELPPELLPEILQHLPRAHYLTTTALVNRAFYHSTVPKLYARASIYSWHKDAKSRVIQLFSTLSTCRHLARYVRRLEIRDFPKNQVTPDISQCIIQGLRNCVSLRSCTWTRDGSLTSDILLALLSPESLPAFSPGHLPSSPSPSLSFTPRSTHPQELEINGHHTFLYEPRLLLEFKHLTRISIIMPTLEVIRVLEDWVNVVCQTLRSLSLICKASPLVTDEYLSRLAPYLSNLSIFHITGCPKVTHRGVSAILAQNIHGIVNLGAEGISSRFDLGALLPTSSSTPHPFRSLRAITLSIPPPSPLPLLVHAKSTLVPGASPYDSHLAIFTHTLLTLLSAAPLEVFHIYSPHTFFEPCSATDTFFRMLAKDHGERLRRISVHRILVRMDIIQEICAICKRLEELFLVVEPGHLEALADCIKVAPRIRTVHVNYPLEAHAEDGGAPVLRVEEALSFVKRCQSPTLSQFGCNARVWHVKREILVSDSGEKTAELYLGRYESPDVPEQFLVVRT